MSPKIVQEYLYDKVTHDPRNIEQRLVTEENIQQLGENISADSPTTYASWLKYYNLATNQSLPWGNFLQACPLSNQLRDIYPASFVESVYSDGLEALFDFCVEINLPEYVRKGPLPTVTKEENTFVANMGWKGRLKLKKNRRSQSNSLVWHQADSGHGIWSRARTNGC